MCFFQHIFILLLFILTGFLFSFTLLLACWCFLVLFDPPFILFWLLSFYRTFSFSGWSLRFIVYFKWRVWCAWSFIIAIFTVIISRALFLAVGSSICAWSRLSCKLPLFTSRWWPSRWLVWFFFLAFIILRGLKNLILVFLIFLFLLFATSFLLCVFFLTSFLFFF